MGFRVRTETNKVEPSLNKTLRLKESMIDQIQDIANKKNISFNFLVSQMLQYCLDNIEDDN